jgi:hypothetical protein
MDQLPEFGVMREALRGSICTRCYQRPPGSDSLPATQPRQCEGGCTLFWNLPKLAAMAAEQRGQIRPPFEHAAREVICACCGASPTAGDYCLEHLTRTCPLSRYIADALALIEPLLPPGEQAAATPRRVGLPAKPSAA